MPTSMDELGRILFSARETRDPSAVFDLIPYCRFLGFKAELDGEDVICRLRYADHLIGNTRLPAIHGGVIGSFLEMAAITQLVWMAEFPGVPRTIDITIDYLRSARPVDMLARTIVTKHGRRVANVRVEAWQDDPAKPVALAHGHFKMPTPPEETTG